jgi:hypothetical protein
MPVPAEGAAVNRRARFFRSGLIPGVAALVTGVAFFAVPSQAAHADGGSCCYVVTPATNPAAPGAGTGDVYAFQVTNNDPNETLKNLTFTAPADFIITAASGPSGTSVSGLPGSSARLKLPSEPAGSTFTVDVTAQTPCVAASSEVWGVSGADSLGETNEVHWSSSPLTVSVTGKCSLAFTRQPAQTAVKSDILTGFNSTGSPLTVQLRNANKKPLNRANFSANGTPVTVSIKANPAGGTLSGTTTVHSSKGIADFGNLQINNTGAAYDLAASASGFTSATSSPFTIVDQIQACGASCSATQSTATTSTSITTSSASGNFAALGLGGVSFTCGHYKAVSDPAIFGVFNSAGGNTASASATVTLTISASAVASSPRPLRFWQVCYASPTPFPAIPGTSGTTVVGGITYHTGLLQRCILCSAGHKEPCLISRRYTASRGVQLTFIALGDPFYDG